MSEVPALEAIELSRHYLVGQPGRAALSRSSRSVLRAVDGVSLALSRQQVVAVVGESGSGKSTLARLLARLERPTAGKLLVGGHETRGRSARSLRPFRRQVQMVFQDPFASLNQVHTVGYHLARPLRIHHLARTRSEVRAECERLLERVSLTPASRYLDQYPHELSGGQRQRVAIARALAVRPSVLIADEPVSMLDVSIRIGVLNLLAELCQKDHLGVLYITHDISSARYFADTVLVMYGGHIVEGGTSDQVTQSPAHPYTQELIAAAPDPEKASGGRRTTGSGRNAAPAIPVRGCKFQGRCPHAMQVCASDMPPPLAVGDGQWARCWLHDPSHLVTTKGSAR